MVSSVWRRTKGDNLIGGCWYDTFPYLQFSNVLVIHRFSMSGAGLAKGRKSGTYQVMPKLGSSSTAMPEDMPPLYKGEKRKYCSTPIVEFSMISAF